MLKLEVLNQIEIEKIHETTLELLYEVGIKVESNEALELFEMNGAKVDKTTNFVHIPENLVVDSLKKVPKSFSLYGPDGSYKANIDTKSSIFATMGAAVNKYAPSSKKQIVKTTLKDAIDHIRVINELDHINCSHVDVWPHDVPFTELHYHTIYNWAQYGFKPYGMSCYGRVASLDMIKMLSIIVNGFDNLKDKPRLIGIFNPLSPLCLPKILLNGLFIFAKFNQPLLISAATSAGSTSPVTLAGTLVQANMEVLSSIILTQLINPGTPVLYGSTNTISDPFTGNVAYGSIEFSLITIASAQMAHYYKIPSKGSGCLTDSKSFDIQNGLERFISLFSAIASGHNYITCAGTYESLLSEALELLIIDDEFIGLTQNYLKNFRKYTNKNTIIPKFSFMINTILKNKSIISMMHNAKGKVDDILRKPKEKRLEQKNDNGLKDYFKTISARTLQEYQKLEDIEDTNTKINVGGVDIN